MNHISEYSTSAASSWFAFYCRDGELCEAHFDNNNCIRQWHIRMVDTTTPIDTWTNV